MNVVILWKFSTIKYCLKKCFLNSFVYNYLWDEYDNAVDKVGTENTRHLHQMRKNGTRKVLKLESQMAGVSKRHYRWAVCVWYRTDKFHILREIENLLIQHILLSWSWADSFCQDPVPKSLSTLAPGFFICTSFPPGRTNTSYLLIHFCHFPCPTGSSRPWAVSSLNRGSMLGITSSVILKMFLPGEQEFLRCWLNYQISFPSCTSVFCAMSGSTIGYIYYILHQVPFCIVILGLYNCQH